MITLNLEANTEEEKLIKEHLENTASETLAEKINNGTKIIKDNKTLLNKKDLNGFLDYAKEQARSSAKNGVAMIHHETVFGWAIHYFEEDSIEGTLYNEDGTEYKKIVKTEYKPPVAKVEVKKKPENEQANFLDMFNSQNKQDEIEDEARKKAVVQLAIGTLSYSELEAVEHIFEELDGNEGLLVASKIADKVGITRSVIVNALRKFESAGVIESRSLGMKGTHIKILNEKLIDELKKIR